MGGARQPYKLTHTTQVPLNPCVIPPLVSYSVCDKVKNSWSKVADMDEKWLKYFCVFGGNFVKIVIFCGVFRWS